MKKKSIVLVLVSTLFITLHAQEAERKDTIPVTLGEIVVTSLKMDRQVRNVPAALVVVDSALYQRQSAFTLSNVLEQEPSRVR